MLRLILAVFFVFGLSSLWAQVQDDFSDGDFTNNPTWSGDQADFKVNTSKKLQLNSSGTDTSYLSTPNSLVQGTEWRFYIKQSFNSSANNHSRIYLVSDQANLKSSLHGYFVQFGSTQDDICLYRQDGNTITKIISGTYGNTGNSVNTFTIKVTRDNAGNWELFSDDQAGNNFHSEGTVNDITYNSTAFFGLWCKYTSSNSTKIYFDDVYVGKIVVDTVAPKLISALAIDSVHLDLLFDEALESSTAQNTAHYQLQSGTVNPLSAQLDASNPSIVHLTFPKFTEGQKYTIVVSGVEDLKGNAIVQQTTDFVWYRVKTFDIVFNELMVDPSPPVLLPEWEYIELYNTTDYDISLAQWTLEIGTKLKTLPDSVIPSHSYMLIGSDKATNDMSKYGSFIGLSSFSLTNSGQRLILKDDKGQLMHALKYDISWYNDKNKEDGGWSIEQIDPANPCGCATNWKASDDYRGGSPGAKNSVATTNTDQSIPTLERVIIIDSMNLKLLFSEPLDSVSVLNINDFEVIDFGKPVNIQGNYPFYNEIQLGFAKAFKKGKYYDLALTGHFHDCVGNTNTRKIYYRFAIPEYPDSDDVVINEILFNPRGDGVDYVELYNRSDKVLDLKYLRLANWDNEADNFDNIKELSTDGFLFFPGSYIVLCTDASIVKKQYFVKYPENLVEIESMISMPNTAGNVLLLSSALRQIDRVDYDEEMQYALLQDAEGISLERINYNRPSNDRSNWHSATTTGEGYSQSSDFAGTPTYINSQFVDGNEFDGEFWPQNEVFSPDNDGYDDVLTINYKFPDAGYNAIVRIYDTQGRLIRELISNELLGTEGSISWDGLDNQRNKARIGMYVVYAEIFNLNGDKHTYKFTVTLAGYLK